MIAIRKKAQAGIFIILGLIMLFSVALFIYFRMNFIITKPEIIPEELQPVKRYAEECMLKSAEEGVRIIAEQGGFIRIPLNVRSDPSMYVSPDGLGIIKMPFWFYQGNRYSPRKLNVEKEIANYVEENIGECIDSFKVFEQYKIIELDKPKVTAFLNKEDVSVFMDYPIRVYYAANNSNARLESFQTTLPVRLGLMIEIANKILDVELKEALLENFTINIMASNPNVPFTGMEFSCDRMEWSIFDIKKTVEEMLLYNLPRIRIKNTEYFPFIEDEQEYKRLMRYNMNDIAEGRAPTNVPEDAYEYFQMFWDIGLQEKEKINIGFSFVPHVGIDIVGRPHDNGILKSKLAQGSRKFIRFFCINVHHFLYDVNYPAIVTIRDELSFNGNGYYFNFAMPVTIHNNEPYKRGYSYDMFKVKYYDSGFCEERGEDIFDIRAYGKEAGYSGIELGDVNISMECITYYCNLGKTSADEGYYRLRTTMPAGCSNPFMKAEKEGYLSARKQITDEKKVVIDIQKLKEVHYKVVFHRYDSISDAVREEEQFEDGMEASIQFITDGLEQYKIYPLDNDASDEHTMEDINEAQDMDEDMNGNANGDAKEDRNEDGKEDTINNIRENDKIELIDNDAEYDIELILTQNGEYIGGYKGKWKPSAIDVAGADGIVFHAIKYLPIAYTKEEKLKMMDYIINGNYKEELKPRLE